MKETIADEEHEERLSKISYAAERRWSASPQGMREQRRIKFFQRIRQVNELMSLAINVFLVALLTAIVVSRFV